MKILTVAAEASPFAKTGDLADVTAELCSALAERGHEVALILPKYLMVDRAGFRTEPIDQPLFFRINNEEQTGWIHKAQLPDSSVTVYFVVNDHYYNRNGIYHEGGKDYPDNLARFTFFCLSVLQLLKSGEFPAQILHCHDWQTALLPAYLKLCEQVPLQTVFTFHNLAYQGFFPRDQFHITGLPWSAFTPEGAEYYGDLNLLKAGLVYSDAITTVSERYAAEVMTVEFGRGMEEIIHTQRNRLTGILNGIDYRVWNPTTDLLIPHPYSPDDLSGKALCKSALQAETGLQIDPEIPLLASIGRYDDQQGIDLIYATMEILLMESQIELVVMSEGKSEIDPMWLELVNRFSGQVALFSGHEIAFSHRLLAGADFLLMPSRYEPCGLMQLCSLKYGTSPIVRQTGGLADTVRDYNEAQRDGYGFAFHLPEIKDFLQSLRRALQLYRDKTSWIALQRRGMACNFSWDQTAQRYERLFQQLLEVSG
jgi:starch synthase